MEDIIIGIDLGTTNSEAAVLRDGRIRMIPVSKERFMLPSVVGLSDNGDLLVGEAAGNQYILHPDRTVRSIKRRMGEFAKVSLGDREYSPQEISAMILSRLKSLAEQFLGQPVRKAVITVPAYFSDAQRTATQEAGEIAGLDVVRILNEPTAAALAYENRGKKARKVLVYDLGGGTFDVSLVNMEHDIVEVLASHGNNHLGGDDFDRKVVDHVLDHIRHLHGLDIREDTSAMARLQRAAEKAKIALSAHPFTTISEEYIAMKQGVPVHLSLELSREEYEELIADYIEETLNAVHIAIKDAHLTVSEIDEVLLVGGSTRTPLVMRRLEESLKLSPRFDVDQDLCVAMGAAIQAGIIAGSGTGKILVDVTPYSFGISAIGDLEGISYPKCFCPVIRKNTPIPVSKSELFYTAADGQESVEITVYQGEDRDALKNIQIGQFLIEGLQDVPSGNPVVVLFSLTNDGIIHVTAREKESGLECTITIDGAFDRSGKDEILRSREKVSTLMGESSEEVPSGAVDSMSELRKRANALHERAEQWLGTAGVEDREDLVGRIEEMVDAMKSTEDQLKRSVESLEDLLFYLES